DDGIFFIENKNIEAEKTLYNSFTYAREENLISYNDNGNSYPVYYLKSFEIENSDDPEKIEYKDLNERYFIVDFYNRENTDINIESEFRSEEHTSELQSRFDLVCRLLLEKKKDI